MDEAVSDAPRKPGFAAVPRRVRWLILANVPASLAFGYLIVLVTAYLPEIGVSSGDVGVMFGAMGLAMVVTAVPLGMYSDRRGRKWLLIAAAVTLPPSLFAFALTTDVLPLVVASVALGIGEGAFLTTWNAIIADQTTVEERDAAFSLSFVLGNVSMGAGLLLPVALPWLQDATGVDSRTVHLSLMGILALASGITAVAAWILLRDYRETVRPKGTRTKLRALKPLVKFSGLNSLIGLGAGFIIPLVPTWLLLKHGVPDAYSGPLLAASNLTIGIAGIVSASLSRRFGPVRAIVMTQGLSTVFMLAMVPSPTALIAGSVYVVRAALMNMASPLLDSFLMGIVPKDQRGVASAVNSLVWRLPNSVTTVIGGLLLAAGSYDLPIYLATSFYVVAIAGFYLVFRTVRPTE